MPAIGKAILPRIQQSLKKKGVLKTAWSCVVGPYYLVQEYRRARMYTGDNVRDEFDLKHGVETSTRVHPTDLKIESPNWIYARGYWPTPTGIIEEAISGLTIRYQDFVFIDFGSGKGRVLLLASEFPFQKVVGIEFSNQLHAVAEENIRRYKSSTQKCRDITSVCMDFIQFQVPPEPLVIFVYNPTSRDVMTTVAGNISESLTKYPREIWVIYVTPTYDVFESGKPLRLRKVKSTDKYAVYTNAR